MFEQVKADIENALLQWQADGQPSYADAVAIEEKRMAKDAKQNVERRRELEYQRDLKQLGVEHD